ncbi:hypothetical protein L1065_11415 [Nereida sp. MMG024]|nr:hypothetical protein [Nereida sp. MMG025]
MADCPILAGCAGYIERGYICREGSNGAAAAAFAAAGLSLVRSAFSR